jgi:hypothetical protein
MNPVIAQREIALAGVALLAAVVSLALTSHGGKQQTKSLLQPVTLQGGQWRTSLAGGTLEKTGRVTNCGKVIEPGTLGVTDSVLPCGIKLYVAYGNSPHFLVQVIERRPVAPGRKFELTPALAQKLGLDGVQRIQWVFAGTPVQ